MKERPILFSAPMVRAILEGRKTQTRRVMKIQPSDKWHPEVGEHAYEAEDGEPGPSFYGAGDEYEGYRSPYGEPGDRLWVRESFQPLLSVDVDWRDADYETGKGYRINYCATDGVKEFVDCARDESISSRITPSIFMPRWASRITLEITQVRVHRLEEISNEDAFAEGCDFRVAKTPNHACAFANLWNSINLKRGFGWHTNPWVWAITFERIDQ